MSTTTGSFSCLLLRPLCPWSSSYSPSKPLNNSFTSHAPFLISGHFSLHTKWMSMFTAWRNAQWEDFPSMLSFGTTLSEAVMQPQSMCPGTNSAYLWMKLDIFPPCQLVIRNFTYGHTESWKRGAGKIVMCLVYLLVLIHRFTTYVLQWIDAGTTQVYDLVGLTEPSLWWAVSTTLPLHLSISTRTREHTSGCLLKSVYLW